VTNKEIIINQAIELLKSHPSGIRYTQFVKDISGALPEIPINTIHGTIWNLEVQVPEKVTKPARGLYLYAEKDWVPPKPPIIKVKEDDFYESFANWIKNELEECTKAIPLGKNFFKSKWGTPDVIGIRQSRKSDILQMSTEIVSAEVKIEPSELITAFGQACAYKLFSHKSYIVIPLSSSAEDIARLDALARIFGIGLILFNASDPKSPEYEIRVRASKHEPDMFYVNKSLKLIEEKLFG